MTDYRGIKVGKESTWGTSVSTQTCINIVSVSINQNRNTNYQQTVGYHAPRTQTVGKYKVTGDVNMQAVPDDFIYLLAPIFGSVTSTSKGGTVYEHVLKEGDTLKHYSWDIYADALGVGLTSAAIKKGVMKFAPGEDVMYTASYVAQKDYSITPAAPTFTTAEKPFHAVDVTFTLGGAGNTTIKALEYTWENNLDDDNYVVTSQYLQEPHLGMVETSISADIEFDTDDELQRFWDGTTSSITPGDSVSTFALTTTLEHDTISGGYKYGVTISTPAIVWDTSSATLDKKNRIIHNVKGKAIYDETATAACKITAYNTVNDYSL